jgi:hypothetical protein
VAGDLYFVICTCKSLVRQGEDVEDVALARPECVVARGASWRATLIQPINKMDPTKFDFCPISGMGSLTAAISVRL